MVRTTRVRVIFDLKRCDMFPNEARTHPAAQVILVESYREACTAVKSRRFGTHQVRQARISAFQNVGRACPDGHALC